MRKGGQARHSFVERVIGTLSLRGQMFAEVIGDVAANQEAIRALVLGSLGPAIGAALAFRDVLAFPVYFVGALILWTVVSAAIFLLSTRLFDTPETRRDVTGFARAMGFAGLPRMAMVLGFTEALLGILGIVMAIWCLAASVIAIRRSLDLSATRAIGAAVIGTALGVVLISLTLNIAFALA